MYLIMWTHYQLNTSDLHVTTSALAVIRVGLLLLWWHALDPSLLNPCPLMSAIDLPMHYTKSARLANQICRKASMRVPFGKGPLLQYSLKLSSNLNLLFENSNDPFNLIHHIFITHFVLYCYLHL